MRTCMLALMLLACGGRSTPPITNTAPVPADAAGAPDAPTAKKCYADPDDRTEELSCGGIGTCLALCKGPADECQTRCIEETCPEVPCP